MKRRVCSAPDCTATAHHTTGLCADHAYQREMGIEAFDRQTAAARAEREERKRKAKRGTRRAS